MYNIPCAVFNLLTRDTLRLIPRFTLPSYLPSIFCDITPSRSKCLCPLQSHNRRTIACTTASIIPASIDNKPSPLLAHPHNQESAHDPANISASARYPPLLPLYHDQG